MQTPPYRKVYIDVYTLMRKDGTVLPGFFIWEDGEKHTIDRVLHITPAAPLKVGGRGIRYTAQTSGRERYLFREDDRWFVEAPIM